MNQNSQLADEQEKDEKTAGQLLHVGHPGFKLRDARKKKGFSIDQIAIELGLTDGAVRDIESEQFDRFFGEIYIRGYLRNYAKFLELDVEMVQRAYDQFSKVAGDKPEADKKTANKAAAPSETLSEGNSYYRYRKTSLIVRLVKIVLLASLILTLGAVAYIYLLPLFTGG